MSVIYLDLKGPTSLMQLAKAINPAGLPPDEKSWARIDLGDSRLHMVAQFDPRSRLPYAVEITCLLGDEPILHDKARHLLRGLAGKRWEIRTVPHLRMPCSKDVACAVCHGTKDAKQSHKVFAEDLLELAKDVVAASNLGEGRRRKVDELLTEDMAKSAISAALVAARSSLHPYLLERIRQLLDLGLYAPEQARQIREALGEQLRRVSANREFEYSIVDDLLAVAKLQESDRESILRDLEAGDFESAIFDAVVNAQGQLPLAIVDRIRALVDQGSFGASTADMCEALAQRSADATDTIFVRRLLEDLHVADASHQRQAAALRRWLHGRKLTLAIVDALVAAGFGYLIR